MIASSTWYGGDGPRKPRKLAAQELRALERLFAAAIKHARDDERLAGYLL